MFFVNLGRGAFTATGTLLKADIPRTPSYLDSKASRFTRYFFNICIRNKLYIRMPADLDQFW